MGEGSVWYGEEYDPGISVEGWIALLNDREIFTPKCLEVMKRMKDYGGTATCKQLSLAYGKAANFYNTTSSALARRIIEHVPCPMPPAEDNSKWWPVLYIGRYATKEEAGVYVWRLREELSRALDQIDLSGVPLYADLPADEGQLPSDLDDPWDLERAARQYSREHPPVRETIVRRFDRSGKVEENAKSRANGICQLCGAPAPFCGRDGAPYLECHHIVWLSQGGGDTVENTVALCPNCHRKMHIVQDQADIDHLRAVAARGRT